MEVRDLKASVERLKESVAVRDRELATAKTPDATVARLRGEAVTSDAEVARLRKREDDMMTEMRAEIDRASNCCN